MRKENGFTLIELMVTIVLLALFAAFAIPAMNGFVEQQRVNSTLSNYTNALTFARNEAIRQNLPVVVCGAQISSAGQLSGCTTGSSPNWSEGIFLYGDADKDQAYSVTGTTQDVNIRVVQSPNRSGENDKVTVSSASRSSTGTPINSSNPVFQFMPNGQVGRFESGNLVVADMYLRLEIAAAENAQRKAIALMDPTGQIIRCTKKTIDSNTGNNIATFCAS